MENGSQTNDLKYSVGPDRGRLGCREYVYYARVINGLMADGFFRELKSKKPPVKVVSVMLLVFVGLHLSASRGRVPSLYPSRLPLQHCYTLESSCCRYSATSASTPSTAVCSEAERYSSERIRCFCFNSESSLCSRLSAYRVSAS